MNIAIAPFRQRCDSTTCRVLRADSKPVDYFPELVLGYRGHCRAASLFLSVDLSSTVSAILSDCSKRQLTKRFRRSLASFEKVASVLDEFIDLELVRASKRFLETLESFDELAHESV